MIVAGKLFEKKFADLETDEDRERYHSLAMKVMQTILRRNDGVMLEDNLYKELTDSLNMFDEDADKFIVSAESDGLLESNAGGRVISFANHSSDKKDALIMQETMSYERDSDRMDLDDIFASD